MSGHRNERSNDDGRDCYRHQVRDGANARAYGASVLNGLEVEGKVIHRAVRGLELGTTKVKWGQSRTRTWPY